MTSSIESALLRDYYSAHGGSEQMSSHWRTLVDDFSARIDEQGELTLSGAGFGVGHYRGPVDAFFHRLTVFTHLLHLSNRSRLIDLWGEAKKLVRAAGLDPTFDLFRQVCTAATIERAMQAPPSRVVIIGDGFGVLGALLKRIYPSTKIVMIDLGQTLLFQVHHLRKAWPGARHVLATAGEPEADFIYCPADRLEALGGMKFDLAVNVASMQEMTPAVVAQYFSFLRRHLQADNRFYCCNRERKVLVGGEVSELSKYPWQSSDRILLDEICPWHRYFLAFGRSQNAPSVMGIRLPLVHYYDGPHRHRLAVMATTE